MNALSKPHILADFWRQVAYSLASCSRAEFIDHLMALLGHMHRADRAWLIVYSKEGTHFWNAHEWVRHGIQPFVESLQGTPISLIDWLHQQLLQDKIVYIADPAKLPRQARSLKAEFARQGNKSVICVPIIHQGRLYGLFGYDTVRQHERWSDDEQDLLREVAVLLGSLINEQSTETTPLLHAHTHNGNHVYVRLKHGLSAVNVDDIVAIHAQRDYTKIVYANGSHSVELRSLKSWQQQLPSDRFIQIARGTIIHSGRIIRLERQAETGWILYLSGLDEPVAIGRAFRHALRHTLGF